MPAAIQMELGPQQLDDLSYELTGRHCGWSGRQGRDNRLSRFLVDAPPEPANLGAQCPDSEVRKHSRHL